MPPPLPIGTAPTPVSTAADPTVRASIPALIPGLTAVLTTFEGQAVFHVVETGGGVLPPGDVFRFCRGSRIARAGALRS